MVTCTCFYAFGAATVAYNCLHKFKLTKKVIIFSNYLDIITVSASSDSPCSTITNMAVPSTSLDAVTGTAVECQNESVA